MRYKKVSVLSQRKATSEECLLSLSNMSRELVVNPLGDCACMERKEAVLLMLFICRGLFESQFHRLGWSLDKETPYIRNLLSMLQKDGLADSAILYESRKYYFLTRRGYKKCTELLENYFMLIGGRNAAMACLYDGVEFVSGRNITSNTLHKVLTNDFHIALASLRPDFPEFMVRHEVAVSDSGNVYIRNYEHDAVCDFNRVKIRIDAVYAFNRNFIYLEQDTSKQPEPVLREKFTNYCTYLLSNSGAGVDFGTLSITFSLFTGFEQYRTVKPNDGDEKLPYSVAAMTKKFFGVISGYCICSKDQCKVRDFVAFFRQGQNIETLRRFYGRTAAMQFERFIDTLDRDIPHQTNLSSLLDSCRNCQGVRSIDEENERRMEKRYRNRRRTVRSAMESCPDIIAYILKGLTVSCVPNMGCADVIKMSRFSELPYVYQAAASGMHLKEWNPIDTYEVSGITFRHGIVSGDRAIIIENISDDLSGAVRIERFAKEASGKIRGVSVMCVCENIQSAVEFIKENGHGDKMAYSRTISAQDAYLSERYTGISFLTYGDLLNGCFKPFVVIKSSDGTYKEYFLV